MRKAEYYFGENTSSLKRQSSVGDIPDVYKFSFSEEALSPLVLAKLIDLAKSNLRVVLLHVI